MYFCKIIINFLQTIQNSSKWWASISTVERHEVGDKWQSESLLWEIIEVSQ